ncbi:MAG: acyl-CoA dehydrogenase [Rhodobacterales bacterium]
MIHTPSTSPAFPDLGSDSPLQAGLWQQLAAAAQAEEAGTRRIGRSIDLLRAAHLLTEDGVTDPAGTARTLMRIGAANLSVGRLWEGHVNALRLIDLYGTPLQSLTIRQQIAQGAFLGVWGADGDTPVAWSEGDTHLRGCKTFASGLGTVTHALVSVNAGPEARLALVDVTDPRRADTAAWDMRGMVASASGRFDCDALPVAPADWIGAPGDYLKEPHFVGGVWRIAALQVGAATGLLDRAATELRASGRMQAEMQKARLMTVLMRAWAGIALVEKAAIAAADPAQAPDEVVSLSIAARLFTEEVGLDALRAVEQSLGLRHFVADSDTGRAARDLSVYLRQVARDAFLQRAADDALCRNGRIWGAFA